MLIPRGPADARMMIVAEAVSYRDLQTNTILTDREFDRMLEEAGCDRNRCFVTALIKGQVTGQNFDLLVAPSKRAVTPDHVPFYNRYVRKELTSYVKSLEADIDLVKPKIILALGNGPLFALTGKWGIKPWRSSIIDYTSPGGHSCKIIPTYTPGLVYAIWKERNVVIHDIRKAWEHSQSGTLLVSPAYKFIIQPSFPQVTSTIDNLLRRLDNGERVKIAPDIETRGGHIACLGFAWSTTEAICIPFLRAVHEPSDAMHYWRAEEEAFIVWKLYKLLTHPNILLVGQNWLYDAQYIFRWFHFIPNFGRDTMLSQHSMFSSMPKGLDFLSSIYCAYHQYWKDESKNWDPKLGENQLWIYNCKDCVVTYEVDEGEQSAIDSFTAGSWPECRAVHDFQQSLFYPVLHTMIRGLRVNNESKARLSQELSDAIKAREDWITDLLGHPLNIKSPKQMTDLFYRVFAQKEVKSRKTHNATCDDAALEKIAAREPLLAPLCDNIRELRSLGVFRSTFLEAPIDIDERMRCSFNIAGTETYRFSSSENAFGSGMNLQNIPSGDEAAGLPNVRGLFICDEEPEPMEYFDIDLDSADLRVVTWDSDCAGMKKYFSEGKKPYVEIAKEYFQDPSIDKSHDAYKAFKVICHGSNYGGGAGEIFLRMPKSAKVGGLDEAGIERIQKWYFKMFPEIADWQKRIEDQVRRNRFVQNVFGYRIWFFDRMEGTIFKQAIASIPQSTVACLINRGYKAIHDNEPEIQILLQVHDSLAGQYPVRIATEAREKVLAHCSVPLQYPSGSLIIPVGIKTSTKSWGDCG